MMAEYAAEDVETIAKRIKEIRETDARAKAETEVINKAEEEALKNSPDLKKTDLFSDDVPRYHGHALRLEAFRQWRQFGEPQ
jgi:hypothetical protein